MGKITFFAFFFLILFSPYPDKVLDIYLIHKNTIIRPVDKVDKVDKAKKERKGFEKKIYYFVPFCKSYTFFSIFPKDVKYPYPPYPPYPQSL